MGKVNRNLIVNPSHLLSNSQPVDLAATAKKSLLVTRDYQPVQNLRAKMLNRINIEQR